VVLTALPRALAGLLFGGCRCAQQPQGLRLLKRTESDHARECLPGCCAALPFSSVSQGQLSHPVPHPLLSQCQCDGGAGGFVAQLVEQELWRSLGTPEPSHR